MHSKNKTLRTLKLIIMTLLLALMILFILQTSKDTRWGGEAWDRKFAATLGITLQAAHTLVFWVRKTIHFIGYGLLGLFLWYYFTCARFRATSILGILSAVLIAGLDEYMQSRTTFRTGQLSDVLLDLAGIISFVVAVMMIRLRMDN